MKKMLSVLLSMVLLMSCISSEVISVFADEEFTYDVYSYIIIDGRITITDYNGAGGAVIIPVNIDGLPVTAIGEKAFRNHLGLNSVTIPAGVTLIDNEAFFECINLETVNLPATLTVIGNFAFDTCLSLTQIDIPESVLQIGDGAFGNCGFTEIIIPDSVTTIGKYAFQVCGSLKKAFIGNGVTTIDDFLFGDCHALTEVVLGSQINTINERAFSDCDSLDRITIPNSIEKISDGAFLMCTNLCEVYYGGDEHIRSEIVLGSENDYLLLATWHYNCVNPKDHYSNRVQHSVMDTANGNGLAFKFKLNASLEIMGKNKADFTNATVNYLGQNCKLVGMGAVISNHEEVVLELESVNSKSIINIPVLYLTDWEEDSCAFATRVINIPQHALEHVIYARPYYTIEKNGEQITIYGEIDSASCVDYM